jgi:hypothetical protein
MKLYKFHSINVNLLNCLRKGTNWYCQVDRLNDPFECMIDDNTTERAYEQLRSTMSACSFSKSMKEILMWSHYANNHAGLCLVYHIDDDDDETIKGRLFPIEYTNDVVAVDHVKLHDTGHMNIQTKEDGAFLTRKFTNWSYEEEVRTYTILDDVFLHGKEMPNIGKLESIYFGLKARQDDIDLVIHNCQHLPEVEFFSVELDRNLMEIVAGNKSKSTHQYLKAT